MLSFFFEHFLFFSAAVFLSAAVWGGPIACALSVVGKLSQTVLSCPALFILSFI